MPKKKRIKNNTGSARSYNGQIVEPGEYYEIQPNELYLWENNTILQADLQAGNIVANDGSGDLGSDDGYNFITSPSANAIDGVAVDDTSIGHNRSLVYDNTSKTLKYSARHQDIAIVFSSTAVAQVSTTSTTYTAIGRFIWRGSSIYGIPSTIKTISNKVSTMTSADIRIQNISANQTICSASCTSNSSIVFDLGVLSNIPTGEAIFEVQAKRTGGGSSDRAYVYAVLITFD